MAGAMPPPANQLPPSLSAPLPIVVTPVRPAGMANDVHKALVKAAKARKPYTIYSTAKISQADKIVYSASTALEITKAPAEQFDHHHKILVATAKCNLDEAISQ
jgi:hypothetical protein